jgi:glycerol-3-phosphate dehydrogenase
MVRRMTRAYGTLMPAVMAGATSIGELGEHFGANLYAREVDYLIAREWARTADDVLWRRSKLGLRVSAEDKARLTRYMDEKTRGMELA